MDYEEVVQNRIKSEMQNRGWSQLELARRLNQVGLPIHQSAISKMTSGAGRKITVNELMAFSAVFSLPVSDMLGESSNEFELTRRNKIRSLVEELDGLV